MFASLCQRLNWDAIRNSEGRSGRSHIPRRHAKPRARFVPRMEALEDRMVPSYVFQTIDDPNAGTTPGSVQGTFVIGINASGLISGNYGDANNVTHGFLLSNGQYTTFDDPVAGTAPGQGTNAFSLNDQGQVVGFYWDTTPNPVFGGFNEHGFLLSHGQYTTLDEPNAVGTTQATAINEPGQIVGYYLDARAVFHGFLLSGGQYTTLDDPHAGTGAGTLQGTIPTGINASGVITGYYIGPNNDYHGFLLNQGLYTTIDEPNAAPGPFLGTETIDINALGQIVGNYETANLVLHGFLLANGQYTTLDDPKAGTGALQGTFPSGINASSKIVGQYNDANGLYHGFLATPAQDATAIRASKNLASGAGPVNVLVAAAALSNATPPGASAVSAANSARTNRGDGLGGKRAGQTRAVVTVPSPLRGNGADGRVYVSATAAAAKHPGAIVDAVFASADDLFRPITPI